MTNYQTMEKPKGARWNIWLENSYLGYSDSGTGGCQNMSPAGEIWPTPSIVAKIKFSCI